MESVPYDKRSGKIWFNGKTVDWADANIHILNHGLHYASCVFEGERVYDGEIFKLEEHTKRLFYSAERMGIKVPYTEEEINEAIDNGTLPGSSVLRRSWSNEKINKYFYNVDSILVWNGNAWVRR